MQSNMPLNCNSIIAFNWARTVYSTMIIIALAVALPSCKKKVLAPTKQPDTVSTQPSYVTDTFFENTYALVRAQMPNFTNLSMRCKLNYDDGRTQQDLVASVRIRKDSLIWISITGFLGIEGARMIVTPDSFFLLNKLTREYMPRPISFLQQVIPLSSSFSGLQSLLLGQIVQMENAEQRMFETDSFTILNFQNSKLRQTATLHRQNYTALELLLADQMIKQDLKITFGDYREFNGKAFSFQRFIEVNRDAQKIKLSMEVQRCNIEDVLTFPFEVNESYKRI